MKGILFSTVCFLICFNFSVQGQSATASQNDFRVKAFHLDLRIQVMTMPALKAFAKKIRDQGLNTLIIEYEASYPFEKHPLIPNRYAYTKAEVRSFVAYCNRLGIDVIPLQQSFGHVEYILRNYRYAGLREDEKDLSQVCPMQVEKDSLLFTELYRDLASTHTSPYIHIGGDETYLLGHCPLCRAKVQEKGISRLYIDYISMLCRIITRLGKRPVLWADIALKYPESLESLPKGTIFVDWNYGWDLNRFGDHRKLVESGFEIWGAPSIRSHPDNYFLTQWEKHFNNIRNFVPYAREMGYKGIVMTSWSTSGAYSYLYESENDPIDLYAIRHVYPITGFNLLLTAYFKSIASSTPLEIETFIAGYCKDNYGFSEKQAKTFWQALKSAPYEVKDGVVQSPNSVSLESMADSLEYVSTIFNNLTPLKNKQEFAHYRLMANIRAQHVRFLEIEKEANSDTLTAFGIHRIQQKLQALMNRADALDVEFINLNKDAFYLEALKEENELRNKKLSVLYDRLVRLR